MAAAAGQRTSWSPQSSVSQSPLAEQDSYADKLRALEEAATLPMELWRAGMVQAWIEVSLGMPQYGSRCADNIKSGKVLLELSDSELESELGITHPLHRKKLRLAIEEHRNPALVRFPCIAELSHVWVSSEWLPDIGLPQVKNPNLSLEKLIKNFIHRLRLRCLFAYMKLPVPYIFQFQTVMCPKKGCYVIYPN